MHFSRRNVTERMRMFESIAVPACCPRVRGALTRLEEEPPTCQLQPARVPQEQLS
jgi:hypothetical protein